MAAPFHKMEKYQMPPASFYTNACNIQSDTSDSETIEAVFQNF